jgi:hypothetical protein
MMTLLSYAERHLEELIIGFGAVIFCYIFARLLGARIRVALLFALIPIGIGWIYRSGPGHSLVAMLNF